MHIRFADRSTHRVEGITDDVEVLVGDSRVASDFAILNIGHDETTPIILGRPFLCTTRAAIYAGTSNIRFNIEGKIKEFSFKTHRPVIMSQGWSSHKTYRAAQGLRALEPS
jgi:hypothetical protein